jgi:hypothetical protein
LLPAFCCWFNLANFHDSSLSAAWLTGLAVMLIESFCAKRPDNLRQYFAQTF